MFMGELLWIISLAVIWNQLSLSNTNIRYLAYLLYAIITFVMSSSLEQPTPLALLQWDIHQDDINKYGVNDTFTSSPANGNNVQRLQVLFKMVTIVLLSLYRFNNYFDLGIKCGHLSEARAHNWDRLYLLLPGNRMPLIIVVKMGNMPQIWLISCFTYSKP